MKFFVRARLLWLMLLLVTGGVEEARASHISGADFIYRVTNAQQNIYQLQLTLYQDCLTGNPGAIAEDNPAKLRVYKVEANGTYSLYKVLQITWTPNSPETVPLNLNNDCITNPPATCLKRSVFITEVELPPASLGYVVAYQRCCRNGKIDNIAQPDGTGATFFATIPPAEAGLNNSAVFKNSPPQIICANNPLVYDNSATDPDGDSLTYEFCEAFKGGDPTNPIPNPDPPPYNLVNYIGGFSPVYPLPSNPRLQINRTTGLLTGTPSAQGIFVVTVCVNEWRNGRKINTTKREFHFVVTNCSKTVVADIPQYSQDFNTYLVECKSLTVKFNNISRGGSRYAWDFGVKGTTTDKSTGFSPTFTYPDTGVYVVKLVVNPGDPCSDSIERFVKVFPTFVGDFSIVGNLCPNAPIQFTDKSVSTLAPTTKWSWNFGNGLADNDQNPETFYLEGGDYIAQLASGNALGCVDTVRKTSSIERFKPFAGNDTTIVKGESIFFDATGGVKYQWQPATFLSNGDIPNPVGRYTDTTRIVYNVFVESATGCTGTDDVEVRVVGQASFFVPSAFTPNGDGLNDILVPYAVGYRELKFFRIFNRFGQMVFSSETLGRGWDGYYGNKLAEVGVYYYVLSTLDRGGKEELLKGDITLLR